MSFLERGAITDGCRPYVLRLSHARLPNISATKEGGCAAVQLGWFRHHSDSFRHHSSSRPAMPWDICSIFAAFVWTYTFSSVSASVVPLSSTILRSRESVPIHLWFVSRFNSGCNDLLRRLTFRLSRWDQTAAKEAFTLFDSCRSPRLLGGARPNIGHRTREGQL